MPRRKKKKFPVSALYVLALMVLGLSGYYGYRYWQIKEAHEVKYAEFGISLPDAYSVHGIDVSKYQRYIDWEAVRSMKVGAVQVQFAFMKATEGYSSSDPQFERNWSLCKESGIIRGAYHYFIPGKSGKEQARFFTDRVALESGDLPPVLDVEQTYGCDRATLLKNTREWLQWVETYYNVKPILYTNPDFYNRYFKGVLDDYPLWVAHYQQPGQPRIDRNWWFWQHHDGGRVNGIVSPVDFNVFNGDAETFSAILIP